MKKKDRPEERILVTVPYQEYAEVDGQRVKLNFSNMFLERRFLKYDGRWCVIESQPQPSDPNKSWLKDPPYWFKELERLGWDGMLADRLAFHGQLTVADVSCRTDTSPQTVRKHFRRLIADGRAKETVLGEQMSIVPA